MGHLNTNEEAIDIAINENLLTSIYHHEWLDWFLLQKLFDQRQFAEKENIHKGFIA